MIRRLPIALVAAVALGIPSTGAAGTLAAGLPSFGLTAEPTILVTTTADSGEGSLRAAIESANATAEPDVIGFAIAGEGPQTITPASPLPPLTQPVTIDGYTQPGTSENTLERGNDAVLKVVVDGINVSPFEPGFKVLGGNSTIRGLVIQQFNAGVLLTCPNPDNVAQCRTRGGNVVEGNFIGTDVTGTTCARPGAGRFGQHGSGVSIDRIAHNVIGGATAAARNLISCNGFGFSSGWPGVSIAGGAGCPDSGCANRVEGNFIGTDRTGTARLGNSGAGVWITTWLYAIGTKANVVGGLAAEPGLAPGNVIAANGGNGVSVDGGDTRDNLVQGNLIGTNVTGTEPMGNGQMGIGLGTGGSHTTIGGAAPGARNVISANRGGISVGSGHVRSDHHVIQGNYIGTDITGTQDFGNELLGILFNHSSHNLIGGTTPGTGNVISGSGATYENGNGCVCATGISLAGSHNVIQGNFIGTQADGINPLEGPPSAGDSHGNTGGGIELGHASHTLIGGPATGAGNVIAFNGATGFTNDYGVGGIQGNSNTVRGNEIHSNVGLAFEFGSRGPTPNDAQDGDTGFNGYQNFPVLTSAGVGGNRTVLVGTLSTSPYAVLGTSGPGLHDDLIYRARVPGAAGTAISVEHVVPGAANQPLTVSVPGSNAIRVSLATNDTGSATSSATAVRDAVNAHAEAGALVAAELTPGSSGQFEAVPQLAPTNLSDEYTIDVYASSSCDSSGYGEGEIYLGSGSAAPGTDGLASFVVTAANSAPTGWFVTATATDPAGSTSEYSACIPTSELPGLSVEDATGGAEDSLGEVEFAVALAPESDEQVTVQYATADGTATEADDDYVARSGTLTFEPGDETKTIRVPVNPDTRWETAETFFLVLSSSSPNAFIADEQAEARIENDDFETDLRLEIADSPDPVATGEHLTYTFTVTNPGPDPAANVQVTDVLPAGAEFVSASDNCSYAAGTVTCGLGSLAKDATGSGSVVVVPTADGTLSNTATVTTATRERNPADNAATVETTVSLPDRADLAVTTAADPSPAVVAEPLTYTLTATNRGPREATNVIVTDDLPGGVTFGSATATQGACTGTDPVICELGTLARNASATITVLMTPTAPGELVNIATIAGVEVDPDLANNRFELRIGTGCRNSLAVDAVTVLADCIRRVSDGVYLAEGNTRFDNGSRIVVDATGAPAPLVIKLAEHRIYVQAGLDTPVLEGQLNAGNRGVVSGFTSLLTEGATDATSGLAGLAKICCAGGYNVKVSLSGWDFVDSLSTVYLVPQSAGGGALVVGSLDLPLYILDVQSSIAVQVDSSGRRVTRAGSGQLKIPTFGIPFSPWILRRAELEFLDGGDVWRGTAVLSPASWDELFMTAEIANGKLRSFLVTYDGTSCNKCFADKKIGQPLTIKYAELRGVNLDGISYSSAPVATSFAACLITRTCSPPPAITGKILLTAIKNRVVALGELNYKLSGALSARGRIFFSPLIKENFVFPSYAAGIAGYGQYLQRAMDFAEARLEYTPPNRFAVSGFWTIDQTGFLRGTFSIGYDSPHFTGTGGVELRVPNSSPILPGKRIGGALGLVSDKAGAGQFDFRICAPKWLGGGCVSTRLSAALLWESLTFEFGRNINSYKTVTGTYALSEADAQPLEVPADWNLAAIRVTSRSGVPNVRLTSPEVKGRRIVLTAANASDPANTNGGLVSRSDDDHQAVFLVANPPAGRWDVERIDGPAIAKVELASGAPLPELRPAGSLGGAKLLSTADVGLRWTTANAPAGSTVDLWASPSPDGAGAVAIATGLPLNGSHTWQPIGVQSGRYYVSALLHDANGVPLANALWPGSVNIVNASAPAAPQNVRARAVEAGAVVEWNAAPGASVYSVRAVPVPESAGDPVEQDVQAAQLGAFLELPAGRRYAITVQSVDSALRRGPASVPVTIAVAGPPSLGGEPPEFAQVGMAYGFTPLVEDLRGLPVTLRLVSGPTGMSVSRGAVSWLPKASQVGRREFTLEASNSAAQRARKTFEVYVQPSWTLVPPPAGGLVVQPSRVAARKRTTLTIRGQALRRGTRVFIGGKRQRAVRFVDVNTIRVTVRCLRRGVHGVALVRGRVRTAEARALTVAGKACSAKPAKKARKKPKKRR